MGLNVSKGNMYDFITHTWNTVKGECLHGCSYCYMKRYGKQNPVRFDEKELKTDLGKDNFIFVGSSCDMWANEIPNKWINDTLEVCWSYFKNEYFFQSKCPIRIYEHRKYLPPESHFCTTIETNREMDNLAPNVLQRANAMQYLRGISLNIYITIEPIMDFDLLEMVDLIISCNPKQVNIGADSGGNNLPEPPKEKILELIRELSAFTIVKQKKNLSRLLK